MINEDKKSGGQEVKQISSLRGGFTDGRSETSPDSEQIEHTVATATLAKLCERGVNPRQSVSDAAIQKEIAPTSILPHKGGSTTPSLEGRLGWVPIKNAIAKLNNKAAFTKPSRATNEVRGELASTETLSFRCKSERWRLMRGAAFTLAEVLITLGIIGVVAAMTMPALIQHHQKQVTVTKLKKTYSVLQNAVAAMRADNEGIPPSAMSFKRIQWNHPDYFDSDMFAKEFDKYLAHIESTKPDTRAYPFKMCAQNDPNGRSYKTLGKSDYADIARPLDYYWVLKDGTCIGLVKNRSWDWIESDHINDHVNFVVDIDGSYRGENRFGRDTFVFNFMPDGKIIPEHNDANNSWRFKECNRSGDGFFCADKIMKDGWQIKKDYPW